MQTAVLESRSIATKPAVKKRSASLDPQVAAGLLDLLSADDAFRSRCMPSRAVHSEDCSCSWLQ